MELATFLKLLLRRSWLLIAVPLLVAITTAAVLRSQPPIYEYTMSFVLRPSAELDRTQLEGALSSLDDRGSVPQSVAGALNAPGFRALATRAAGGDDPRQSEPATTVNASVRPESALIDVTVRGSDPASVARIGDSFAQLASRWVARTYPLYELESLGSQGPPRQLTSRLRNLVVLASGVGLLLAVAVLFLVPMTRPDRSEPDGEKGPGGSSRSQPSSADATPSEHDGLDSDLRPRLRDGQDRVHAGDVSGPAGRTHGNGR